MNLVKIGGVALISSGVANAFTYTANMPLRHPVALATCSTGAAAARRATKTSLRMVASPDKGGGMVVEGPFEGKVCGHSNRRIHMRDITYSYA